MSSENVEIVRRSFEAFNRTFTDGLLAGSQYQGYEGIRRFAADFFAAWDDLRVEPQDFRESEGRVVVVLRMKGQMHELELDEIWSGLFTLRDGRVIRVQGFASPDGALEAAGLAE